MMSPLNTIEIQLYSLVTFLSIVAALPAGLTSNLTSSRQLSQSQLLEELQYLFGGGVDQHVSYGPAPFDQLAVESVGDVQHHHQADAPSFQLIPDSQQFYASEAFTPSSLLMNQGEHTQKTGEAQDNHLDHIISGLDQLASLLPAGQNDQQSGVNGVLNIPVNTSPPSVPIIDPELLTKSMTCVCVGHEGLFVIQGVKTCGNQTGYCMLGSNCSSDSDFSADLSGHCTGLRSAFSPPADFVCCRFESEKRLASPATRTTPTTTEGTTFDDGVVDAIVNIDGPSSQSPPQEQLDENSQIVDIVAIITDTTGIVDIVTRPYTGPWPPEEEQHVDGHGVTLPFAKPGQTFDPESLAGINQPVDGNAESIEQARNSATTPMPVDQVLDAFEAGDLTSSPDAMEMKHSSDTAEYDIKGETDRMVTLSPSTEMPRPERTTFSTPPKLVSNTDNLTQHQSAPYSNPLHQQQQQHQQQLGPLAEIPVMEHDQDYIGEIDYDHHLLPALVPHRFTTGSDNAGSVWYSSISEGSGFEYLQSEFSGKDDSGDEEQSVNAQQQLSSLDDGPLDDIEEPVHTASGIALTSPSTVENNKPLTGKIALSEGKPKCGVMGSSLATLLARSKRPIGRLSKELSVEDSTVAPFLLVDQENGGSQATSAGVWCWMAAVVKRSQLRQVNQQLHHYNPEQFQCSGTLVHFDLVVTSANCAASLLRGQMKDYIVLLGASIIGAADTDAARRDTQRREISRVIIHENYLTPAGNSGPAQNGFDSPAHDIALILLTQSAVPSRTVCLLCIPSEDMAPKGRENSCVAASFASVSRAAENERPRNGMKIPIKKPTESKTMQLRQVTLSVISSDKCPTDQQHHPHSNLSAFVCSSERITEDGCEIHRSGSPVVCKSEGSHRYYLYGIATRISCDNKNPHGGFFTNVAKYSPWIWRHYERISDENKPEKNHSRSNR